MYRKGCVLVNNRYDPNNNGYNQQNGYSQYSGYDQQNGYNQYNGYGQQTGYSSYPQTAQSYGESAKMSMAEYSKRIYGWLGAGLGITFIIGFVLMKILTNAPDETIEGFLPIFFGGMIVELVMVIVLGFFIRKLPYVASLVIFGIYSVCNGITLTPLLVVAGGANAVFAFAATAVLFGAFSIYGLVTKRDLTKLGPILMIGLIVLIVYSIIAMIFGMDSSSLIISLIGIALFIGFTAYDTQKIKSGYNYYANDEQALKKSTINVALELYLDFINLFIYILRLLAANRR